MDPGITRVKDSYVLVFPWSQAMPKFLASLPPRFQWTLHNLVAHPLSEVLFQVGLEDASNWVHDQTIPVHEPGTGRG
jgi:hypothetical protein